MTGARWCTERIAGFDPRLLQTGTGTPHITAISAAISITVIFSLVDKSMASLRTRCQPPAARPIRGLGITL